MTTPNNPPKGGVLASALSVIQNAGASYNALTKGFTYSSTNYVVIAQRGSNSDTLEWTYGTTSEAATNLNPVGKISSATWNVIHAGTYDSSAKTFSYSGSTYEIRIQNQSGSIFAEAVVV